LQEFLKISIEKVNEQGIPSWVRASAQQRFLANLRKNILPTSNFLSRIRLFK
jgi:hypothetical protein